MLEATKLADEELYHIVAGELKRQENNIEMIASESTAPIEALELSGSVFTNKTLEGYPGARFQSGAGFADQMEILGVERCKALYQAEHANIQPISGSTANYSVYAAILKPGDTVLAMRLDQGGHLTHGSPASTTSKFYNFVSYGVHKDTEQINYEELEALAIEHKPKLIVSGGSSYPRLIDYERIGNIAKSVGAYSMADIAHVSGLVAAGIIPSPVPCTDFVSSSTTKTLCGPRGGMVLCKAEHAKALDRGVFPRTIGSMHLQVMAAKTFVLKRAATEEFKQTMIQTVKNAQHLATCLEKHGFRIVSGGTDNHLVMVDLRPKGITGKDFQDALDYVGITVNKNMIPFDTEKPSITSGVRIGTTAISQRGLKENEVKQIADIMNRVAQNIHNVEVLEACKIEAIELISKFPLYKEKFDVVSI
ncbi:serine hydroxymethyltransferase [Cytobacillus depressus]|uniref:2-methylserine hydroxymethyltransferase n=1 Tax=Cytobacillus depressus TaxID=1602942 RepID=A0A6L3V9W4_9BACI|nr:serine hydroxymethyltransferase [Cytobacillus depressus]KAB2337595.1 serine hydroxymethyltransferase [Cytobacillus depressus]